MKNEAIRELIQKAIWDLHRKLPSEIKDSVKVAFTFDEDTIIFMNGKINAAQCERDFVPIRITFFLDVIRQTKPTYKKMKTLVQHEFGHALGMSEEEVKKLET